jgi:hypothetical protein
MTSVSLLNENLKLHEQKLKLLTDHDQTNTLASPIKNLEILKTHFDQIFERIADLNAEAQRTQRTTHSQSLILDTVKTKLASLEEQTKAAPNATSEGFYKSPTPWNLFSLVMILLHLLLARNHGKEIYQNSLSFESLASSLASAKKDIQYLFGSRKPRWIPKQKNKCNFFRRKRKKKNKGRKRKQRAKQRYGSKATKKSIKPTLEWVRRTNNDDPSLRTTTVNLENSGSICSYSNSFIGKSRPESPDSALAFEIARKNRGTTIRRFGVKSKPQRSPTDIKRSV